MTGEAAGAAMVYVLTYQVAGTLFFSTFDFRYHSDNTVVDMPVEVMFPGEELYVNCGSPAWHNQYRHTTGRAIVQDVAGVINNYGCS